MRNNQTHKTSCLNYNKKLLEVLSIRPIAFNPLLAKATGSIKAGLLLAQLLYWWQKGRDKDWIYKTIKEIEEETALSRNEQDSAIKRLKQLGLIEVKLKKVPARRHFHLSLLKISNLVCGSSSNLFEENQQPIPETTSEISSDTNANALQVAPAVEYGNKDINLLISYLKEKLSLPLLDGTVQQNRRYAHSLIRKFDGVDKVKLLIDATAQDDFWATKITSFQQLFYKAVQIISKSRKKGGGVYDATNVG